MILRVSLFFLFLICSVNGAFAKNPVDDPAVVHANNIRNGAIAYKEGYYGTGDARLHYVEAGKGPLIVMYHGFPSFWYSYFDQMEVLKTHYRVVAVDALGAGRSAKPLSIDAYRIDLLAAQVDKLARHLNGGERFTLIGHDWGAALAFAYAQGYPDRLNAVIGISAPPFNLFLHLVGNNADQQSRSQYMQLFRTLTLADLSKPGTTERIWQQTYGGLIAGGHLSPKETKFFRHALTDPEAINGGMNWYRANIPPFDHIGPAHYWPQANPKIKVPALLIWGEADRTFVNDFIAKMPEYADDFNVVTLPKINHWATMESPEMATQAIETFLRDNRRSANKN